jgi:hypothetical protein
VDYGKTWRWEFLAFQSAAEGRVVQRWFNALPEEDKYEITDLVDALQKMNNRLWPEEVFDPLKGAGGISEIKIPNIKCFRDSKAKIITYRIYGFFGPGKRSYTFLHGAEKDVKNDTIGKQIAKDRLDELRRGLPIGLASVHKFEFEEGLDSETEEKPRRPN